MGLSRCLKNVRGDDVYLHCQTAFVYCISAFHVVGNGSSGYCLGHVRIMTEYPKVLSIDQDWLQELTIFAAQARWPCLRVDQG
jgi:hypothetical protein